MLDLGSKSSLEGKKFLECKEYREKGKYQEIERDNYIILSSKLTDELPKTQFEYHIIAEIPNYANAYMLYHSSNRAKAKMFFDYFAPILNPILRCKFSVPTQIEILKKATRYPRFIMRNQWTLCHVFAKFNIFEVFDLIKQNPKSDNEIMSRLNQNLPASLNRQTLGKRFTALHMAIGKKCFKFAEKLLQLGQQSIDCSACNSANHRKSRLYLEEIELAAICVRALDFRSVPGLAKISSSFGCVRLFWAPLGKPSRGACRRAKVASRNKPKLGLLKCKRLLELERERKSGVE